MRHTRGVIDRTAARTRGSGRLLLAPGLRESAFRLAERTRAAQQNQVFRAYR